MMRIIDTHIHDWSRSRARQAVLRGAHQVLHSPHRLSDLDTSIDSDIVGVVLVSADQDSEQENATLARLAANHHLVVATIGHLNLHADDIANRLRQVSTADPHFRGVRYTLARNLDGPWTEATTTNARHLGTGEFLLEIFASPAQLTEVAHIAAALPDVSIVVDHIATGPACTRDIESWFASLAGLASRPNVTAKLSNFGIPSTADVVARTRRVIDLFGPDRLMFASNWPVCLRSGSYADALDATLAVIDGLSADAQDSIMYRTAARVFEVKTTASNEETHVRRR